MAAEIWPNDVGIVDDRREKIHRVDDRQIGTQTIHPGIVGGFSADQHIGMVELRQLVQNLREVGGAELGGSTRGLDLLRQAHDFLFSYRVIGANCNSNARRLIQRADRFAPDEIGDFSRRMSPIRIVSPSRSKYSNSGIVYLRLEPIRSRNGARQSSRPSR